MSVRLAIDIGGTFTDATLIDEDTGEVAIAKVLTTPADPSDGFMQAADRALAEGGVAAGDVTFVVHATTVATNAIIEGKIARGGFVTTEGFRDLLQLFVAEGRARLVTLKAAVDAGDVQAVAGLIHALSGGAASLGALALAAAARAMEDRARDGTLPSAQAMIELEALFDQAVEGLRREASPKPLRGAA